MTRTEPPSPRVNLTLDRPRQVPLAPGGFWVGRAAFLVCIRPKRAAQLGVGWISFT